MIINCENCGTRFRLPEEKMRTGGIKVRCAKCKQIFTAAPPAPEPAPVEEEISFGGLESSAPPPAQEEAGPDDFDFGVVSGPEKATGEEEDEDSEFSFAGLDFEPPQEEEDFDLGGRTETADEDLDSFGDLSFDETEEKAEKPSEPAADLEPPSPAAAGEEDSFAFGELSFGEEEEASAEEMKEEAKAEGFVFETPDEADFSLEQQPTEEDTAREDFSLAEPREEEEEDFSPLTFEEQMEKSDDGSAFADEKSFDDAADQDQLQDFTFSEQEEEPEFTWEEEPSAVETQDAPRKMHGDPFAAETEPAEQAFNRDDEAGEDLVPAADKEASAPPQTGADKGTVPSLDEKSAPVTPAAPRRSPVASLMIFLLVALLILTAVTGYLFWAEGPKAFENILGQFTGEAGRTPAAPVNRIEVTEQSGRFVVNRHAGELFVINGQVANRYPEARSAIQVKGIVYNQQGRPVLQQTVFCGNPMDEETLRSLPFARIEERMNNQFGDNLSNLNVAPGGAIPFTIVFRNLPDKMAEFTIEVVDSRAAAK